MQVGTGRSILNGIAIGKLKIYKKKDTVISTAEIADTAAEVARFEAAQQKAIEQQTALYEKALAEAGEDIAEVFNIHAMMLEDDDFVDAIKEIINGQHKCAEYAVKTAGDNQAAVFAAMDDPYLQARSADVIDIAQAILDILQGVDNASLQGTEPSILVAEDLAPSETVRMDKSLLLGFITREGSSNSHTAILARSMNIPALIQCKDIQDDWDGKMAVVDGYNACVYVDPTPDLLKSLKKRQQEDQKKQALLQELKGKPNTTLDGKTINVFANIGGMGDVGAVQQNDAGGVGLFRTEFVYLNCKDFPTEDYQFEAYKQVLESLAPRKVVVRTCDIGADKTVDYMKLDHEDNPALGYRAIRICLTRKDFFKTQLRALLRASAYGNMSIMFPMITSLRELQDAKAVLEECRAELTAEGVKMGQNIEVGTMIETPAAVLIADELAQECDFFSIGTNDLTQYTCALDRQNAKLEPFFNPHHPAVLRAIKMTIEAGHRHGIWVGICGELGADTALTETFLRMGVDELSMNAKSILPVRKIIRSVDLSKPSDKAGPYLQNRPRQGTHPAGVFVYRAKFSGNHFKTIKQNAILGTLGMQAASAAREVFYDAVVDPSVYPSPRQSAGPAHPGRLWQSGQHRGHGVQCSALPGQARRGHAVRFHRHHGRCPEQPVGCIVQYRQSGGVQAGVQSTGRGTPLRPCPV